MYVKLVIHNKFRDFLEFCSQKKKKEKKSTITYNLYIVYRKDIAGALSIHNEYYA